MSVRNAVRRSVGGCSWPRSLRALAIVLFVLVMACGGQTAWATPEEAQVDSVGASSPEAGASLRASDPLLPAHLGTIESRFEGEPGKPLVFVIGESHVRLEVQKAVADILGYLYRTFDVRVIGSEGFAGPLPLPAMVGTRGARHAAAWTELNHRRNINAVEYAALTLPEVEVYGVSDLVAYDEHGEVLDRLRSTGEEWQERFRRFLEKRVATLRVTERDGTRLLDALGASAESGEYESFGTVLCEIAGRSSAACREVEKLVAEQEELEASAEEMISSDQPLMARRDRTLAAKTLARAGRGRVALVVGYLHVAGVERELRAAGVPHLVIVPPGVEKDVTTSPPMSEEDREVWERWDKSIPTELESWLDDRLDGPSRHKPSPTLEREGSRNQVAALNALLFADHLLLAGAQEAEVLRALANADLPEGFEVAHCRWLPGGVQRIDFRAGEGWGYALFGDRSSFEPPAPGAEEVANGELPDGRHYVVFGGGSGGPPSLPPGSTTQPPDDEDPFRRLRVYLRRQQRENPQASTIAFRVAGNRVFRFVDGVSQPLWISPAALAALRRRLDDAPRGPDMLEAAQKLAEALLMGLEDDLSPEPSTILYQVVDQDLLGTYSLPFLAKLADHPSAPWLRSVREVYTVPHESPDLEAILSDPAPLVHFESTVFWVSNHLVTHPDYPELIAALEASGARVNAVPTEGDTLILLGDPDRRWTVDLQDAGARRVGTDAFRAELEKASAVVAVGAGLSEADLAEVRGVHTIETTADRVPELGRRTLEAISRASGRETLDRAVRDIATEETAEVRKLLGTNDGFASLTESVASTSLHATLRSRT